MDGGKKHHTWVFTGMSLKMGRRQESAYLLLSVSCLNNQKSESQEMYFFKKVQKLGVCINITQNLDEKQNSFLFSSHFALWLCWSHPCQGSLLSAPLLQAHPALGLTKCKRCVRDWPKVQEWSHSRIHEPQNHKGWKRPLTASSPTLNPNPLNHIVKGHICSFLVLLQGWWRHHCHRWPIPMISHHFSEKYLSDVQP